MARTESRTSQERENQTRDNEEYTFEEEDYLAIPEEVKERVLDFRTKTFSLIM